MLRNSFFLIALIFIANACTNKIAFVQSPVVPAAEGEVKLKKDKNDNTVIELEVVGLAEPDRLTPPANVYVVWMDSKNYGLKNLGQLQTSSSFLSKTMKAKMKTVTVFTPESIFISAEQDPMVTYPSSQIVMRTEEMDMD